MNGHEDGGPLPTLPARDPMGHKGTFGVVGVIGGSCAHGVRMIGAPALVARGAFRAGAGLVKLACPAGILSEAIALEPSATGIVMPIDEAGAMLTHEAAAVLDELAGACDALVVGPGLGGGAEIEPIALRAVKTEDVPVVLDADALNALSRVGDLAREWRCRGVVTPHAGEWRRLASAVRASGDPVEPGGRAEAAASLAQRLGCVVVLKGARTVVSDGLRVWTCPEGDPCLATAGTGDVLAGVIAALAAAYVGPGEPTGLPEHVRVSLPRSRVKPLDLFDAARLGVTAHARAGAQWASDHGAHGGAVAREVADLLPIAIERLRVNDQARDGIS